MYVIVWEYEISKNNQAEFESEYGTGGAWSELFMHSENYLGSYLSEMQNQTYLLIDTWTDKLSYENFKNENREIYDSLCARFEHLYEQEELLGAFDSVD